MTAEQQNIGNALVEAADIMEKLIPLMRSIGEGLRETKKVSKAKAKALPEAAAAEPAVEEAKTYTLEDVRAVLADKSRSGYTEEVKNLISKYGADRLSAIDPSNYEALLADAEVIGNE